MKNQRVLKKIFGVIMAIFGAVIIIHTVPVFVWYLFLAAFIVILALIIFFT